MNRTPKKNRISTYTVTAASDQLLNFLLSTLKDQSRTTVKSLLAHQQITVNKTVIRAFDHALVKNDVVEVHWDKAAGRILKHPKLKVVFEDKYLMVVEKDAGLLSVATPREKSKTAYSILNEYVKQQSPGNKVFVVQRLDRESSGLLLFAKTKEVQALMQDNWRFAVNQRKFMAVLEGKLTTGDGSGKGTVTSYLWESKAFIVYASNNPDEGLKAVTHYQVLRSNDKFSLVAFNLDTTRKNQIRVQMNSIGYPVSGDIKYGGHKNDINRIALHACELSFTHPITGEKMSFESKIPASFEKLMK
ncbi:MAG: RluA family pseudouridine synthase [Bacteroidales bacterium]|nr:RluA family pseudouridine synthase [Bacteroidales bacterium]